MRPELIDDVSQSALDPAGVGAARIADLFHWMVGGGVVIWLIVIGLAVYSIVVPRGHRPRLTKTLVIGGGAVVPTIVLSSLLCYALAMLPDLHQPPPTGSLTVQVSGVRWWWRVQYRTDNGQTIETANEIRLPVGEAVDFKLTSEDVIHSFWIPSLGGKVDMIPGRMTRLKLHPTRVGTFRGVCAEYCGTAHAQMRFDVIVMRRPEFDDWLSSQRSEAREPAQQPAIRGSVLFKRKGCGACHTIRGTEAQGRVGPDLTHLASRISLGAAIKPNHTENLRRWITETHHVKPGVTMPAFQSLDEGEVDAIVAYLEQLH
ncbi:Cytochrome c oxidase subunit 2 precursor [Stieleria maiorica]|uniref:Cytochrome aa3 subunit 2 n=1 Tax=Stieleria maiorica TaxID=2795974 RepID=A0A5B9MJD0_9BACT|nr:cytochrome c oxidase subunit II [Stieleria maiorica]QEG01319.1 Cytochrome c oxidase subunit 2 precursor [Stieleria maiorica]